MSLHGTASSSTQSRRMRRSVHPRFRPRLRRLRFEPLEDRRLLVTVNSEDFGGDWNPGDGICETQEDNGICTLAAAIDETNASAGMDEITFSVTQISGEGLPQITDSIVVDGDGRNVVLVDGGLAISGPGSTVRGMVMPTLQLLSGAAGSLLVGNTVDSVDIDSSGTIVGGGSEKSRNIIASLRLNEGADDSTIVGNYLGVDETGTQAVGAGLQVESSRNRIGGTSAGQRNIIGASLAAIFALGIRGNENYVAGNYVGLTPTGDAALAGMERTAGGIMVNGDDNLVGGTSLERNVISGFRERFTASGIMIGGPSVPFSEDKPIRNRIQNNYIGTDATGMTAIPNKYGVYVLNAEGVEGNMIGGPGVGNLISGNDDIGIVVNWSYGIRIQGNVIGLAADRDTLLGNGSTGSIRAGIYLVQNSTQNLIGGTGDGQGNLISGNNGIGIHFGPAGSNPSQFNFVRGNYIGTDASGQVARGNTDGGIQIESPNNTIGGSMSGAGNVISGNGFAGIIIRNTRLTTVQGNRIGSDATGRRPLANNYVGIALFHEAHDNLIGGDASGAGNVIAFNMANGVQIESTAGTGNRLSRNSIFSNQSGSGQPALGIDLDVGGVTPNDFEDVDSGPNNLQNFPVLSIDGNGSISGSLNAEADKEYTIELFANSECDPSGHGEGERFLKSFTATTDSAGRADFDNVFVAPSKSYLTATATDPDGNTSEYSACELGPFVFPGPVFLSGNKSEDLDGNGARSGDEPGLGDWRILLDLDSDGGNDGIAFTNSDGDYLFPGLAAGPNINLTSDIAFNFSEGSITINPTNPNNVVAFSNIVGNGLFRSVTFDGGATWQRNLVFSQGEDVACCDPSAAFDDYGNLFLTFIQTIAPRKVVVAGSLDGGVTFETLARFNLGTQVDQPSIATGADSLWVTFRDGNGTMSAAGTRVSGFGLIDLPFTRRPTQIPASVGNYGEIAIGPFGQVLVAYQNPADGEGPAIINVHLDPDGLGATPFGNNRLLPQLLSNVGGMDIIPAQPNRSVDAATGIVFDRSNGPYRGRAYLLYNEEIGNESNDLDVLLMYSDDDGATWSDPVRVNDDSTTNSQFFPKLAVDQSSGLVAVSWYDARMDAGAGGPGDTNGIPNDDVQFWASVSFDGGDSFVPNVRVSQGTTRADAAGDPNDLGDYSGLAFENLTLYPLWSDNSNSTGDNGSGALSTLGLYTSKIRVIPAGTHTVSEQQQPGYMQTMPAAPGVRQVTVLPGIGAGNLNFANFELGEVRGTKFLDLNNDGNRAINEPGLSNWSIYLNPVDADGDGNFDGGLMETVTDADGSYRFEGLEAGDYTIGERQVAGYRQSLPDPPPTRTIMVQGLSSGESYEGLDFGNAPTMSVIRGVKYDDRDGDGVRDPGEPGLAGWTVFLDSSGAGDGILNNPTSGDGVCDDSATEPCAITDALGAYTIGALPFGNYPVREVARPGWVLTSDLSDLVFADGLASVFSGPEIGNFQLGRIDGRVFNDFNGRGYGGPPKKGQADVVLFLDQNQDGILNRPAGNGQCDAGATEPCVLSDELGYFFFADLAPGNYAVRTAFPAYFQKTYPVSQAGYDLTIDASGAVINRIDFGLLDPPPQADLVEPLDDATVSIDTGYVDVRWSDPSGMAGGIDVMTIDVADLAIENAGNPLTIDRVENLGSGVFRYVYNEDGQVLQNGDVLVTFVPGQVTDSTGNFNSEEIERFSFVFVLGGIHGYKFEDRDDNGLDDQEPRLGGVEIRLEIDEDRNGVFERSVTTLTASGTGAFAFTDLLGGTYRVTEVDPQNQTTPTPELITLASGEVYVAQSGQVDLDDNQVEVVQTQLAFGNRNTTPWRNPSNRYDVDGRNGITPVDVLIIINFINSRPGNSALPAPPAFPPPYYDVSGDNLCTPKDVLFVVNYLNANGPAAEGAGEARQPSEPRAATRRELLALSPLASDPLALDAVSSATRGASYERQTIPAPASTLSGLIRGTTETRPVRLSLVAEASMVARRSSYDHRPHDEFFQVADESDQSLDEILNEITAES